MLESTDSVSIETGSEQSGKKAFEIAASDMIDKQKIEDLENDEKISVGRDSYGNIKIIRGKFTELSVNSEEDAVYVLNAAASLFGSGFQFEIANLYRGKTTEIDEVSWACTPTVNGILVHGSHITLYTRNGEITELDSSFDYRVLDADAEPSVTEETVCETALNAYFKNDDVHLYVEHIAEISGHTEKEVADVMRDSVAAKANLFFDSSDEHKLFWDVSVADIYDSEAR